MKVSLLKTRKARNILLQIYIFFGIIIRDEEVLVIRLNASELYRIKTNRILLYNILHIDNIPSVIQNGILCYDLASRIHHVSIALSEVQQRRDRTSIPHGLRLHQYANLYFTYHNPMMFRKQDLADELCILGVSTAVLDIEGCVVSDRNAAADLARFYPPDIGIESIDFNKVFSKYWTHPDDPFEQQNHKAIKCAEVLVPYKIDYSFIEGACVYNERAAQRLSDYGFNKKIHVSPKPFFK